MSLKLQDKCIKYAIEHLWRSRYGTQSNGKKPPLEAFKLNRTLHYIVSTASQRLEETFDGEVNKKDIILIVEAYIASVYHNYDYDKNKLLEFTIEYTDNQKRSLENVMCECGHLYSAHILESSTKDDLPPPECFFDYNCDCKGFKPK